MSVNVSQIVHAFSVWQKESFFDDVKINMRFISKKRLYQKGYKYCNICNYMVKTDINFCPVCNRKYRTTIINSKCRREIKMFSEPIISVGIIKSDLIVDRIGV